MSHLEGSRAALRLPQQALLIHPEAMPATTPNLLADKVFREFVDPLAVRIFDVAERVFRRHQGTGRPGSASKLRRNLATIGGDYRLVLDRKPLGYSGMDPRMLHDVRNPAINQAWGKFPRNARSNWLSGNGDWLPDVVAHASTECKI